MNNLKLHARGCSRRGRFGVSAGEGLSIWYGGFGKFERMWTGNAADEELAELSAMHKALWVAGKVREGLGYGALRLHLSHSLAFEDDSPAAVDLYAIAHRKRIFLDLYLVPAAMNAASVLIQAGGFEKYDLNRAARCVFFVYPPSDR